MPAPSTTAQRVFDITMGLIDEVNENSGETDTADTREYKMRTLLILNALRGELYPYSDTYEVETPGERPIVAVISDFETPIDLDDYICQTVLPYGLAAQLLLDENPSAASFFQQRYEELRNNLSKGFPQDGEAITDVYGVGFEYNEFSRW
jgi:hypothetical protein|nr:MAG TPA: hypothetical protein [Caudoviricetes sp.]DAS48765.1 MAG TPA: hypothetical protein [Caudoviricetes sp.]